MMWKPGKFGLCATFIQVCLVILFVLFVHYGPDAHAADPQNSRSVGLGGKDPFDNPIKDYYGMFQDIHMMLLLGFALFLSGAKRYSYSAVGLNMFLTCLSVQFSLLAENTWSLVTERKILLSIQSFIRSEFACLSVLVSFGAVLGRASPLQLLTMAMFHVALSAANRRCSDMFFKVYDKGGSIFIHTFGAYFGLAVSYMILSRETRDQQRQIKHHQGNIFSAIGILSLFALLPSFNSVFSIGDDRHRAVINTYLALTSSCVTTFAVSSLLDAKNRLSLVHIRNGTIAGGVAIGACADMMTEPYGAMIIGSLCGALSVVAQKFLSPLLSARLKVMDEFSVHSVHGIPGLCGGFISVYMNAIATEDTYGTSLYDQFPARAPVENSTELYEVHGYMRHVQGGLGRTSTTQATYQLAAIGMTLAAAITGGLMIGSVIRRPFFEPCEAESTFDDSKVWNFLVLEQSSDSSSTRETQRQS